MAASVRCPAATEPGDLTELRLLVELSAFRKLADRGLSDQEFTLVRRLADASIRSARRGDVLAYLQADMTFHLCLLELTGDPALSEIAALLLAPDPLHAPRAEVPGYLMAREAREHCGLVDMLADGMVGAAEDLLRQHLSRLSARCGRPHLLPCQNPLAGRDHDMTDRITSGDTAPSIPETDLVAFFRHRDDVPAACGAALIGSLSRLRRSDDPVVTFAGLPGACVPGFADGCQVELTDGAEPLFRVTHPDGPQSVTDRPVGPDQVLATPFRVVSRTGYPSYAGVITHWWTARTPSESDAVIVDLVVKYLVALVDQERLMAAAARAEDRAASLALEAISGRTMSLATGIVMHQNRLAADDAKDLLRQSAGITGRSLQQVAASVVRSGSLGVNRAAQGGVRRLGTHRPVRSGQRT